MNKPNVLLIADKEDIGFIDTDRQSNSWNIFWKVIDYAKLHKKTGDLKDLIKEHKIDFVMYSRNDQVARRVSIGSINRLIGIGYSSFSGIDEKDRTIQMAECFDDFIRCDRDMEISLEGKKEKRTNSIHDGTFSLIFDTEQLGGVRYGLPRLLEILNRYDVKATFFITNIINKVYPNISREIQRLGHELGIHGFWHEYLAGLNRGKQKNRVRNMVNDFDTEIHGANFIGRMDEDSMPAFIDNGIKYLVYPFINRYYYFSYPKLSTLPSLINSSNGNIWALPISVETYGSPWFSIKHMLDSAISQSVKCEGHHISVLCHPFRDGSLRNIGTTEKLLYHLCIDRGLTSIALKDVVDKLSSTQARYCNRASLGDIFDETEIKLSRPKAKRDFFDIIPQNLIMLYKLVRKRNTVF